MSRAPQQAGSDARLLQGQVATLSLLAQLTRRARHAATIEELAFLAVNETHGLVPYRQAALWRRDAAGIGRVLAVSGAPMIERNAPFPMWLEQRARRARPPAQGCGRSRGRRIRPAGGPRRRLDGMAADPRPAGAAVRRRRGARRAAAGARPALAGRRRPAGCRDRRRLRPCLGGARPPASPAALAHAVAARPLAGDGARGAGVRRDVDLRCASRRWRRPRSCRSSRPVVRAPLDGVVERIVVQPNQDVAAGELLLTLDPTHDPQPPRRRPQGARRRRSRIPPGRAAGGVRRQEPPSSSPSSRAAPSSARPTSPTPIAARASRSRPSSRASRCSTIPTTGPAGRSRSASACSTIADPAQGRDRGPPAGRRCDQSRARRRGRAVPEHRAGAALRRHPALCQLRGDRSRPTAPSPIASRRRSPATRHRRASASRARPRSTAEKVSLFYYLMRRPLAALRQMTGF